MWVVQDQRTPNKRAWQGRGGSKLKLRPPPALAAPSSQPAARATSRPVPATRRSSTQPMSDRATKKSVRFGTFITVLPNWLKMTFFRPLLRRKRSARKGGGHQDDRRELDVARTSRSRRPQRCRFAPRFSAIFTFLGKKVVYPLDNLGASSTNFQSR
jgi:hypothetical protein